MTDYVDAIEMAKDIIASLEHFVKFTEPNEVEDDFAERIKEAYDLLVMDETEAKEDEK